MPHCFGEVVLVPFPFTDQSGTKKRPAVIVSSSAYNTARRDLVIMAITSEVGRPLCFGEARVAEWQAAGLIKPSVFKPILTTIEQCLVVRTLGTLTTADQRAARSHRTTHRLKPEKRRPPTMALLLVSLAPARPEGVRFHGCSWCVPDLRRSGTPPAEPPTRTHSIV